ncbi:hypothetical protein AB5J72_03510 [Streptomyces sp. CG1]|uniref:hypothetical protein n=1 Tax=Streptomyces sp. CG1 TaxID=1287523 RepID=UPI0034E21B66
MTKFVLVPGNIRRDSLNASVLATVRRLLAEQADGDEYEIDTLSVGRLPLYDRDVEQACGTHPVRRRQGAGTGHGRALHQYVADALM